MKVKTQHQRRETLGVGIPQEDYPIRLSNINLKPSLHLALLSYLIVLFATGADARKTFFVKQQHPALYAPKVQAYDTSIKLFDIENGEERYRGVVDN